MQNRHELRNEYLSVSVLAHGAELCSLRDAGGREFLWQAGPQWPRHAPNLFPIVGELAGGSYVHAGRRYAMQRHGFARSRGFAWLQRGATQCRLALHDDAETRAQYPFAFRFEVSFALEGDALEVGYVIANTGHGVLPASAGGHPAFVWPLSEGVAKTAHSLVFSDLESPTIRRIDAAGLILPQPQPSPFVGRTLALDPALFLADALILDRLASSSVRYGAPGTPAIEMSWDGFTALGVWQAPGADFLCIEPWAGHASPVGFDGDIMDKPGMLHIRPGEQRRLTYRIRIC